MRDPHLDADDAMTGDDALPGWVTSALRAPLDDDARARAHRAAVMAAVRALPPHAAASAPAWVRQAPRSLHAARPRWRRGFATPFAGLLAAALTLFIGGAQARDGAGAFSARIATDTAAASQLVASQLVGAALDTAFGPRTIGAILGAALDTAPVRTALDSAAGLRARPPRRERLLLPPRTVGAVADATATFAL